MYGRTPVWLQDLGFVLGAGAVAYGSAQFARRYGKPLVPALVASGVGVGALVARNYTQHDFWAAVLDGGAGGGVGYGWVFAAANTFGKGGVPLMVPAPPAPAAHDAQAGRVVDIASRQGRRSSVATRGLALGA